MKTDRVVTMSECLTSWYGGVSWVKPPARDARHVLISAEEEPHFNNKADHCRCDRWGHPCEDCEHPRQLGSEQTISEQNH